jgi:uncharacterized protein YceH (UPF0502 family)
MSQEDTSGWPTLSIFERRVLGVLVEKQKTTDTYPLSLNAVVTGSNQKSNRDPLLDLSDEQVEAALTEAQKKGLVMRVISGRVDKWKHLLYEAWKVNSLELAVLAELLLRGPQTEGELRARASRMEEIADLDTLRQVLTPLKERRLVVYLGPEGRRGTMLTHGFHDLQELERIRTHQPAHVDDVSPAPQPFTTGELVTAAHLNELVTSLKSLEGQVKSLKASVRRIEQELGLPPS